MAYLAELDLATKGAEARLRALLEDLIAEAYTGLKPGYRRVLALAVWFGKRPGAAEQDLLLLFPGPPMNEIDCSERQPLLWKTGSEGPPFARLHWTSVDYFLEQLRTQPSNLAPYFQNWEVLYFEKRLLDGQILQAFNVITEPSDLVKGWYVDAVEYAKHANIRGLLGRYGSFRPEIGLLKIWESPDFDNSRGLLHVEVNQRWIPLSPGTLSTFTFYNDTLDGRRGYFLFEGGSLYQIRKVEVKRAPEYAERVLEKPRDDRYAEVYLRAVHPPEQPAA